MGFRLLHIYASEESHKDAWIVGDVEALTALRDAVDLALKGQELDGTTVNGAAIEAFAQDGEGFTCFVRVVVPNIELSLPYSTPPFIDGSGGLHPFQLGNYLDLYNSRIR